MTLLLRPMTHSDLAAVMTVQADCYPTAMVEDAGTLRQRLEAAADFAWVADDHDGVCAYLVACPARLGKVTRLGAAFTLPDTPDCLYLHDLAVSSRAGGRGIGVALVRRAWEAAVARGLRHSALVSVQDSRAFWERLGYVAWPEVATEASASLASYAAPACYMARAIGEPA